MLYTLAFVTRTAGGRHCTMEHMTSELEAKAGKPRLGASVLYRGRAWVVVACNESKQTADIKLPERTGKHDTSLTLAGKDLRYIEAAS